MKVLVACEFSGTVRKEFAKLGHNAWSCDLLPSEEVEDKNFPIKHIQGDIFNHEEDVLNWGWDLMIAHPPCTYLTNAGVRHLFDEVTSRRGNKAKIFGKDRWFEMKKACGFFKALQTCYIPRIAIENPIPHRYARDIIGDYTQLVRPWYFGEKNTKAICLWLKGLPPLQSTNIIKPPKIMSKDEHKLWHSVHMMSPSPDRSKKRSIFFKSVAEQMSIQWNFD